MPYKFQGWTLYTREVQDKGELVTIYFFSKRRPKIGVPEDSPPDGYDAVIDEETGLPSLRESEELRALKKLPPFEFQALLCQKLGARAAERERGDMGIDGWLVDGRPLQIKRQDGVGRPVVDAFETAIRRTGNSKGVIVAFTFSRGAYDEVERARNKEGLEVELKSWPPHSEDEVPPFERGWKRGKDRPGGRHDGTVAGKSGAI